MRGPVVGMRWRGVHAGTGGGDEMDGGQRMDHAGPMGLGGILSLSETRV